MLNVRLFNPHSNLLLSLKIRKGRLRDFKKFSGGNIVECGVMLLTINFSSTEKTKTEKLGRAKELDTTQDSTILAQSLVDPISLWIPTQQF